MEDEMKYLSLFSGYGGFELGIQQAYERTINEVEQRRCGQAESELETTMPLPSCESLLRQHPTCIGFSEIDKYAIQVYKKHFPYEECESCRLRRLQQNDCQRPKERNDTENELEQWELPNNCKCKNKEYGDIKTINASDLPDFDLLVGGFPCQAFSIAGKRAGFEDTRGTLIYDVFRIIKEKHPRLVLLENVKGLLSHDSGRTFKTIITSLAELGYAVEWQVLNAKNFGVPQNRERVFIVGHLRGFGGRQVFPIRESNSGDMEEYGERERICSNTLKARDYKGGGNLWADEQDSQERRNQSDNSNSIRRTPYTDGMRIRRLTPIECERLMGLPDGWTEYGYAGEIGVDEKGLGYKKLNKISDTQRYKLCGNGVVVNVVEEIIKRLI